MSIKTDADRRLQTLRALGASPAEAEVLLEYNCNIFHHDGLDRLLIPLTPELHATIWEEYRQQSEQVGVFTALCPRLVQFSFPIEAGISQTAAYRDATRKGVRREVGGLSLERPEQLQLRLHACPGGILPILIAGCRADFVTLVQALVRRNEPEPVSDSMGACLVQGLNNWDRVRKLRMHWESGCPEDRSESAWHAHFRTLVPRKELYQDRLVILSQGPYSNIPASALGLDEAEWLKISLAIRLEHECTHYFTYRALGSARNNLFDELLCDYMGITAATGRYSAAWFLKFLGLEDFPTVRADGRVHLYRGKPPLPDAAFAIEQQLTVRAAHNLEAIDRQYAAGRERIFVLLAASHLSLEELASEDALALFEQVWDVRYR